MIVIGIAARPTSNGCTDVLPSYLDAIKMAGATPVLLRPEDPVESMVHTLHGILIPGGADVDPAWYGQSNTASEGIDLMTDGLDQRLITLAKHHHLPLFGICRGLQVINVALGGTLVQDIPTQRDSSIDHNVKKPLQGHRVRIDPNSRLAKILGTHPEVNSYHHQGLDRLADGLRAIAWSADGLIEAVEGDGILAVQWHPERMTSLPEVQALFDDFVRQCSPQ